jgi:hypothetical protein
MFSALLAELVLTFMFLLIILGSTDRKAPAGFAPIAIGLGLTLIHLIGIPVTNLSVNPSEINGASVVRRRLGSDAALAILGCTIARGRARRSCLQDSSRVRRREKIVADDAATIVAFSTSVGRDCSSVTKTQLLASLTRILVAMG